MKNIIFLSQSLGPHEVYRRHQFAADLELFRTQDETYATTLYVHIFINATYFLISGTTKTYLPKAFMYL